MEAYRNGTWTRPTVNDPALFPGLGGCKAIVQQTRQQPVSSPASSDGNNVLVSLEGVQPTLDDYLRSFQPQSEPNQGAPMGITSSDDFLRGALTGDWGRLAPIHSEPTASSFNGKYNDTAPSINVPWQEPVPSYNQQPMQQGMFSASPYSDGGVSSGSNGNGIQSTFDYTPPFQALGSSPPVVGNGQANGQAPESVLLWDNFLRDLGLQNVPR